MEKIIVVHYGEVAIKGKNREFFERLLVRNIRRATGGKVKRKFGRIEVEYSEKAENGLAKIPGVKYFGVGVKVKPEIDMIKEASLKVLPESFRTFKVETSRSSKRFSFNSMEVNKEVGAYIVERTGKKVNLSNPDVTVWIEICDREAYVYVKRVEGIGGLPIGSAGKVVALVSGGIDSPVASFMAMKRGCEVIVTHFFNRTLHSPNVRRKIHMLAEKLAEFQGEIKLYLIPFQDVQVEIIKTVPPNLRMIVYRRSMMRMANVIAEKEGAKAVITGDNLSQVASQTLENLNVIFSASQLAVLPPLIGMDKEEIVSIAKSIETYEISILPYEDCCTFMIAKHPETKAKIDEVVKYETFKEIEEEAVKKAEIIHVKRWGR